MPARNAVAGALPASVTDQASLCHERGEAALQRAPRSADPGSLANGVDGSASRNSGHGFYYGVKLRLRDLLWHVFFACLSGAIATIVPHPGAEVAQNEPLAPPHTMPVP